MKRNGIPSVVIERLPRYYRYLSELKESGVKRISSKKLAKLMKATSSQVRQDFNWFGDFGQQGYGYNVMYLRYKIGELLGINVSRTMIIIGAGNLGQALANYDFERFGLYLIGIFDVNPRLEKVSVNKINIRMMEELNQFLEAYLVDIAILTVPERQAVLIAHRLERLGIKAIWNFAPIDLNLSEQICVRNVHLDDSLMILSYEYHNIQKKEKVKDK